MLSRSRRALLASGSRNLPQPQKLRPNSDQSIARALILADWLEELAVFGVPEDFHDAETAHHMAQSLRHRYLWQLGLRTYDDDARQPLALQELDDLQVRKAIP